MDMRRFCPDDMSGDMTRNDSITRCAALTKYAPPESFELRGKRFDIIFGGEERVTLDFSGNNCFACYKIKDAIWLVAAKQPHHERQAEKQAEKQPEKRAEKQAERQDDQRAEKQPERQEDQRAVQYAAYVLDLETKSVTRAAASGSGEFTLSFGVIGDAAAPAHTLTDEPAGNTVEWTLGTDESALVRAVYGSGALTLKRPLAPGAPLLPANSYSAVKISDTVFFQTAVITAGKETLPVCLLGEFRHLMCVGCIFDSANGVQIIGGHGRYPKDAYQGAVTSDLRKLSPFDGGSIRQFSPPRCFELAGNTIEMIMDDGYDFYLHFLSGSMLEWNIKGEKPAAEEYFCLKADDMTYLVSYELSGAQPRVNHTFVVDIENMLVTRIVSSIGKNPRWPYLMKTEFEFGAVKNADEYKSYPRHGFTSDLTGNIVQWAYGSEMSTVHLYYCSDYYRLTHARDRVESKEDARENYVFADMQNTLPSTDEPTVYIKIKEGMYLISLTEINCEKLLGAKVGFRSNTLCFLQNYKRCYDVGRAFGTTTKPDGTDIETHISIGAYGRMIGAAGGDLEKMMTDPNPYLI